MKPALSIAVLPDVITVSGIPKQVAVTTVPAA